MRPMRKERKHTTTLDTQFIFFLVFFFYFIFIDAHVNTHFSSSFFFGHFTKMCGKTNVCLKFAFCWVSMSVYYTMRLCILGMVVWENRVFINQINICIWFLCEIVHRCNKSCFACLVYV